MRGQEDFLETIINIGKWKIEKENWDMLTEGKAEESAFTPSLQPRCPAVVAGLWEDVTLEWERKSP